MINSDNSNNQYYLTWDEPSYANCAAQTEMFSFFSEDIGYTQEDINYIAALEIGQTAALGLCDHHVKRVK